MNICINKRAANITCLFLVSLLFVTFTLGGCKPKKASKCPSYDTGEDPSKGKSSGKVKYNKDGTVKSKRRKNEQRKSPFWSVTYYPGYWH